MPEAVLRLRPAPALAEQAEPLQLVERVGRNVSQDAFEQLERERPPERGCRRHEVARRLRKTVEAGEDRLLDGRRHLDLDGVVEAPAVVGANERADVGERADELLEEERVPVRGFEDAPLELGRQRRRRDERREQLAVGIAQRTEVDLAQQMRELAARVLAQTPGRVVTLGPQRQDEQHRSLLRQREQLFEQEHRGRVGPVKILEREHERSRLGQPGEQLADDLERPPLQRLRRELRGARLSLVLERDLEQAAEVRVELVRLVAEELVQPASQADADAQFGLLGRGTDPLAAQEIAERPVRQRLAVRDAAALEPAAPFSLRELAQLIEKTRLADSRVAGDDEDAPAARAKRLERLAAQAELSRAPDEPGLDPGEAALRATGGRDAGHRPRGDRLALSLQVELARVPPLEEALDRAMGGFVDEHRPGIGSGLQPRGDVHRVAERGELDPGAGADLPHHDRAGRRSDPDAETLGTPAAAHLASVLLHLGDDAEGTENRPLGVVLARRRRAEEGEDSVTGEILDVAAERLDLADDPRNRLAHDELHVLWVEPLCERGRADDVGEDGRQDLALLPHGGVHTER